MKTKPKPPVKLPKGEWMRTSALHWKAGHNIFCLRPHHPSAKSTAMMTVAVLPCRNRQEAREIARMRGMSEREKVEKAARALNKLVLCKRDSEMSYSRMKATAVLQALHLIP